MEEMYVSTLGPSILKGSQVTRKKQKTWMCSNFGQILSLIAELAASECLKNRCIILLALLRLHFDRIFIILAGKKDSHKISDEFKISPPRTAELADLERLKNFQ